ncbi:MAG TPA: tetratricopeptide repeat protein, partial [Bacteroidetes bacterium]|nr:tetratricopeptide repeat protein [Bacteroidota bacterium]HEX04434.1 tetratricopeptide repeat protein [Bacteroidota bacterium]
MISYGFSLTNQLKSLFLLLALLLMGCAGSEQLRTESADTPESVAAKTPSPVVQDYAIAGAVYEAQGEFMLALREYDRGLMRDSTSTELYHAAAQMHTQLGDLESAMLILKKGVRVNHDPSLLSHLGEIQLQQRKFEEAAQTFAQLIEMEPDDLAALQNLAMSLERSGQIESALEIYDELLELDEIDTEPILMRKVSLLSSLKRFEEAVEVYEKLQELRPGEDRIPFFIGGLFLDMGDTTRAVESIASATKMRPIEPRYWDMWIRLEVVQGHVDRAIELSDSAMSYNPADAPIHALAASVFIIKGLNEKAE